MDGTEQSLPLLIVDDNEQYSTDNKNFLVSQGYQVFLAKNGQEGWALFQQHLPKVVVLDLVMPEKDGLWFLEQVKTNPQFANTPIIVLTNLSHGEKIARAVITGVARLLVKEETKPSDLAHYVREVLNEYY